MLAGRRGAVGISFLPLVGRLVPLSPRRGLAFVFPLCCLLCVFCVFDSLRVLLARVVCLFVCLVSLLFLFFFLLQDPGC